MAWSWHLDPEVAEHAHRLPLTDTEKCLLSAFAYEQSRNGPQIIHEVCRKQQAGSMWDMDERKHEAYLSLCRMAYIVQSEPRVVRHAAVEDVLSEAGQWRLTTFKPWRYKCCEFAVSLPCVCSERKFCPNPEHASSNGCHGTHD
jgi:hypothetical protein